MKKLLFLLLIFLISGTNYAQDFIVENSHVDIYLSEKGYFDVVENYDLVFSAPKHGIYRTIRTDYKFLASDGVHEKRKIKITDIEVPGHKFKAPFGFVQKLEKETEIKIGDPNLTVIGPQKYQIRYRVHNAFIFEDDKIQ